MFLALVKHRTMPGRALADVILPSVNLPNAVRAPWNLKYCLNFTGHRTMSQKLIKNRTILPAPGQEPYGRLRIVRFLVK